MTVNIVFGSSGVIGLALYKILKKKKNFLFFSNKKYKNFNTLDLNKSLKKFSHLSIETCFFLASPRYIKRNFNKDSPKEYEWLKNVILNLKIKKFIYISSPSIFYKEVHFVGKSKIKCENYIKKNKHRFNFFQIWRPYNLVGPSRVLSDHFHNTALKIMFNSSIKKFAFKGSADDQRGYSDAKDFAKIMFSYSKNNISFIKNFGNRNTIKTLKVIDLYNFYYKKIYNTKFKAVFLSQKKNISKVTNGKNSVYNLKSSVSVLNKYIKSYLNEKKMLNL